MRPLTLLCPILSTSVIVGCAGDRALDPSGQTGLTFAKGGPSAGPVLIQLPTLGRNSEAWGVNAAGTIIVGHSFHAPAPADPAASARASGTRAGP